MSQNGYGDSVVFQSSFGNLKLTNDVDQELQVVRLREALALVHVKLEWHSLDRRAFFVEYQSRVHVLERLEQTEVALARFAVREEREVVAPGVVNEKGFLRSSSPSAQQT